MLYFHVCHHQENRFRNHQMLLDIVFWNSEDIIPSIVFAHLLCTFTHGNVHIYLYYTDFHQFVCPFNILCTSTIVLVLRTIMCTYIYIIQILLLPTMHQMHTLLQCFPLSEEIYNLYHYYSLLPQYEFTKHSKSFMSRPTHT